MAAQPPDVTATAAEASEGGGAAGGLLPRQAPGTAAASRARANRSQTLADLQAGRLDAPAAAKPAAARPARAAEVDEEAADDGGGSEMPLRGRAERDAKPADDADERKVDEKKPAEREADGDPETNKRLAKITDAEKRSREKLAGERAALEKFDKELEEKWRGPITEAKEFSTLKATATKAVNNPALMAKILRTLGITEEHFEPIAQGLYSMSKAGQADPARRAHVERVMRERQLIDRDDETEDRIAKLEKKLEAKEQETQFAEQRTNYVTAISEQISDEYPIAAAALAKTRVAADAPLEERKAAAALRRKFETRLFQAAEQLWKESGDETAPEPADVLAYFEKIRGAELDELGIARPSRDTKPNGKPADKKQPATTLSSDLSTARVPRTSTGGSREHRAETRRMIESGKVQ